MIDLFTLQGASAAPTGAMSSGVAAAPVSEQELDNIHDEELLRNMVGLSNLVQTKLYHSVIGGVFMTF